MFDVAVCPPLEVPVHAVLFFMNRLTPQSIQQGCINHRGKIYSSSCSFFSIFFCRGPRTICREELPQGFILFLPAVVH